MKKCWFLALVAVGLVGCAESSDDSCNDGQVSCNGKCVAACTTGTLNPATCVCESSAQTCEQQGKVTCNNVCYEKCADNAARDPNNSCACPGQPVPTCEEQGKVTCKNACVDKCATGKTLNTETCLCEGGEVQTCEEQGKVTCGGVCYEKCENDGVRDEANGCACPGKTEVTCEEQGKVTCKDSCVDACATGKTLNIDTCECEGGEDNTCQDQGKVACGGTCYDPCPAELTFCDNAYDVYRDEAENCECVQHNFPAACPPDTKFDKEKCDCVEDVPVDTKCSEPADCKDPSLPVCDTESGECVADTCGNGVIIAPEICDPTVPESFANMTCEDLDSTKDWKEGGKPGCSDLCHLSTGSCVEKEIEIPTSCGDGRLDKTKGELCEDDDDIPKSVTCASLVSKSEYWTADSRVTCNKTTCQYDTTTCVVDLCGNGVVDEGEACDLGRDTDEAHTLITEKQCTAIDPVKYASGKVQCTNNCKKKTETCELSTGDDKEGLYWCQLMEPTTIVLDANKTQETVTVEYGIGSDINASNMKAQLVISNSPSNISSWISAADATAGTGKFTAVLTSQKVNHWGDNKAYYTFRISASGTGNDWKYCQKNEGSEGTVNGKLVPTSELNDHKVGVATISNIVSGNILAKFDFSRSVAVNNDLNAGGATYIADSGSSTSAFIKIGKSTYCDSQNQGGCYTEGANKALNVRGFSKAKDSAMSGNGYVLISDINANGASNMNLSMDIYRSNEKSSSNVGVMASTDGTDFTEITDIKLAADKVTFHSHKIELNSTYDNAQKLYFKLVPYGPTDNTYSNQSYLRFDNIVISKNN